MHHHSTFQVHDDRQVDVSLGRGNLVDGDLSQVFQFRLVEPPLQVALLDLLDHVPTNAQMIGHVLDGHMLGKFQSITLKGFSVGDTRIGKSYLHLPDDLATTTFHPWDRQGQVHQFAANGNRAETTEVLPPPNHVFRPTGRTAVRFPRLLNCENHLTPHIRRLHVPIASNPKRMVK